jgi:hypothetical protein
MKASGRVAKYTAAMNATNLNGLSSLAHSRVARLTGRTRTLVLTLALFAAAFGLGGCSVSRYAQLKEKSGEVESSLRSEQRRVVALPAGEPERAARLDHLTGLRAMLSAANIGLGATRYAVPEDKKDLAYDVLDEAYGTIEWNIPLGPSEPKRAMPSRFSGGVLKLD